MPRNGPRCVARGQTGAVADMSPVLLERWHRLVAVPRGAPAERAEREAVGRDLLARYAEAHRAYHVVAHLDAVLRTLDELAAPASPAAATELAAWFHDAVYDPRATDNEERSRDLAATQLRRLGLDGAVQLVGELIMATKAHDITGIAEAGLLLDADLAVLGAPPDVYRRYARAIRREYAHVPDDQFRTGRATVLHQFLDRDHIYATAAGRTRFEAQARVNLRLEADGLAAAARSGPRPGQ